MEIYVTDLFVICKRNVWSRQKLEINYTCVLTSHDLAISKFFIKNPINLPLPATNCAKKRIKSSERTPGRIQIWRYTCQEINCLNYSIVSQAQFLICLPNKQKRKKETKRAKQFFRVSENVTFEFEKSSSRDSYRSFPRLTSIERNFQGYRLRVFHRGKEKSRKSTSCSVTTSRRVFPSFSRKRLQVSRYSRLR